MLCANTQHQQQIIFAVVEIGVFDPGIRYLVSMIVPLAEKGEHSKYTCLGWQKLPG